MCKRCQRILLNIIAVNIIGTGKALVSFTNISSTSVTVLAQTNFSATLPFDYLCYGPCEIYVNENLIVNETAKSNVVKSLNITIRIGIDVFAIKGLVSSNSSLFLFYTSFAYDIADQKDWKCMSYGNGDPSPNWNSNLFIDANWQTGNNIPANNSAISVFSLNASVVNSSNISSTSGSHIYCRFVPRNKAITSVALYYNRTVYNDYSDPAIMLNGVMVATSFSQTYTFVVTDLEPFVNYAFWVEISTSTGVQPDIGYAEAITAAAVPTGPVQNLVRFFLPDKENSEQHSLMIYWDPPITYLQHGPLQFYNVSYRRESRRFVTSGTQPVFVDVPALDLFVIVSVLDVPYTLTNLTPDSTYTIGAVASTSAPGLGPSSKIVLHTRVSAPLTPPTPTLILRNLTNITISWPSLSNQTGLITKAWIIAEPYEVGTNSSELLEIITVNPGDPPLPPLPFPLTQIQNATFNTYDPLNTCSRIFLGYTFKSRLSQQICGGFCHTACEPGTPMMDPNNIMATNDQKLINNNYIMNFVKMVNENGTLVAQQATRLVPYLTIRRRFNSGTSDGGLALGATDVLVGDGKINEISLLNNTLFNASLNYRIRLIVFTSDTLYAISDALEIPPVDNSKSTFLNSAALQSLFIVISIVFAMVVAFFIYKRRAKKNNDLLLASLGESITRTASTKEKSESSMKTTTNYLDVSGPGPSKQPYIDASAESAYFRSRGDSLVLEYSNEGVDCDEVFSSPLKQGCAYIHIFPNSSVVEKSVIIGADHENHDEIYDAYPSENHHETYDAYPSENHHETYDAYPSQTGASSLPPKKSEIVYAHTNPAVCDQDLNDVYHTDQMAPTLPSKQTGSYSVNMIERQPMNNHLNESGPVLPSKQTGAYSHMGVQPTYNRLHESEPDLPSKQTVPYSHMGVQPTYNHLHESEPDLPSKQTVPYSDMGGCLLYSNLVTELASNNPGYDSIVFNGVSGNEENYVLPSDII